MDVTPIKDKHKVEVTSAAINIAQLISLIKYDLVKMLSDKNFYLSLAGSVGARVQPILSKPLGNIGRTRATPVAWLWRDTLYLFYFHCRFRYFCNIII